MAITYVGGTTAKAADGGNATADLTLITGLAQNDVCLAYVGVPRNSQGGTSSTDWVQLEQLDQSTISRGTLFRKVMGATPDTSFVAVGTANAADATIVHVRAYRGVDTTTPEDATTTEVGGNSTNPDPPAITTVTNGAMVVAFAASNVNDAATTIPSGYGNGGADNQADTRPMTIGGADLTKATAGAEDPASWTNWNSANWTAMTVALRPASSNKTLAAAAGSFALTGQTASLEFGRVLVAAGGSFALTGQTASLEYGREIAADAGAFTLTGQAAALEYGRELVAEAGSFAFTGQDATLSHFSGKFLTADAGGFSFNGTDATLTVSGVEEAQQPTGGFKRRQDDIAGYLRRLDRRREDEAEPEKPVLEVVRIGKAKAEVITGLVVPTTRPAQRLPRYQDETEKLAASQFNASRLRGNKLRQLQAADDDWLMLN